MAIARRRQYLPRREGIHAAKSGLLRFTALATLKSAVRRGRSGRENRGISSAFVMYDRQNPIFWAWTAGRVWRADIRLSWLLPAFALVFVVMCGWQLGLAYFTILMLAVLAHEFGHVFAA